MRKLIVSEFMSLDGVIQAPGGKDEDPDGGFEHGGWTIPYWHDDIGASFGAMMQDVDAFLLGRRTYVIHAQAFEPMPPGDPFGDMMNAPKKYVVSRTLEKPIWRDTTIIRDDVVEAVRALKAAARQEHPHGRQQSAGAHAARARPRGRAAPAALPADARPRQAHLGRQRVHRIHAAGGDAVSDAASWGSTTCGSARSKGRVRNPCRLSQKAIIDRDWRNRLGGAAAPTPALP